MSSEEQNRCNCEGCSELETLELVAEATELILEAKTKGDLTSILYEMCEFAKVIGIKEYIYARLIDDHALLDALNTIGEDDIEDDEEIDFKFSLEAKNSDDEDGFFTGEFWSQS